VALIQQLRDGGGGYRRHLRQVTGDRGQTRQQATGNRKKGSNQVQTISNWRSAKSKNGRPTADSSRSPERQRFYSPGSFIVIPAGVPHFAAAKEGTVVVQLSGMGKFQTDYLEK